MEDIQVVGGSCRNTQSSGGAVQRHTAGRRAVHAAEIDGENTVDEHPHVVVTHEIESLAAGIGKLGVGLGIEVVVVRAAFMPEALAAAPVPSSGK